MAGQLAAFLGVSLLLIVTPGPDMALVLRNALLGGRRSGVFTALGVVTGLVAWTIATSAGVAALLLASEPAFVALKIAGAAYLIYLGAQALWAALRGGGSSGAADAAGPSQRLSPMPALRQGVISNLGNPKIAVFFTSFLPQFAPEGRATFSALLLLGLAFCALGLLWLVAYAIAVAKAGHLLRRPRICRAVEGISGAALIALGLRLATAHR